MLAHRRKNDRRRRAQVQSQNYVREARLIRQREQARGRRAQLWTTTLLDVYHQQHDHHGVCTAAQRTWLPSQTAGGTRKLLSTVSHTSPDPAGPKYDQYCQQSLMKYKSFHQVIDLLAGHGTYTEAFLQAEDIPLNNAIHLTETKDITHSGSPLAPHNVLHSLVCNWGEPHDSED